MKIEQMTCVSCGAPIQVPPAASRIQCDYCGTFMEVQRSQDQQQVALVKTVTEAIQTAEARTEQALREDTKVTQIELKRMQLNQEIHSLRFELASIQREIRALERGKKSRRSKQQLTELREQERRLLSRVETLRKELVQTETPKPQRTQKPITGCAAKARRFGVTAAIAVVATFCGLVLLIGILGGGPSSDTETPEPSEPVQAAQQIEATSETLTADTAAPRTVASPTGRPTDLPTDRPTLTPTAAAVGYAIVANARVNLRAGPGTNYDMIGSAVQGDQLPVFARNQDGTWLQISEDGSTWIAASIVHLEQDASDVPVAAVIPSLAAPSDTPQPTGAPTARATPSPTRKSKSCAAESAPVWHAVAAVLMETFNYELALWDNPSISFYTLADRAGNLARAASNIPHPACLDTLNDNMADVLWNYWTACQAMRDGDLAEAEEALYWTDVFLADYNAEYARLSAQNGWSTTMIRQWNGVSIGTPSDDVIAMHPAGERTAAPVNLGTTSLGMVVKWSYPDVDLIFIQWEQDGVTCYRVRQIYVRD